MFKRIISAILVTLLLLSALVSCSDTSGKVMQIGDLSDDGVEYSGESGKFVPDSDYISESLFKYLYLYFKDYYISMFKQYESYGYSVTGDSKIPVGDTEAFWTCAYSKDEEGNVVTFADELYKSTVTVFEDILALETVAEKYGYSLPETYDKDFNEAMAQQIVANGSDFLQGVTEITDKNGDIYAWVENRWAMKLMSEGITSDAWERVFYTYTTVISQDITAQLSKNGVIKAEDDSVLKEKGEKALKEKIDAFMESNMKIKHIAYFLKVEEGDTSSDSSKDAKNVETFSSENIDETSEELSSVEVSDDSSNEASDDSSEGISEELSPKEFNEQLRKKCKDIYDGLLNGTLKFDDESKKSDVAENAAKYPDGIAATFDAFKQSFGESVENLKVGDIKMYEYGGAIHIIEVQELTEKDSGISTELTEEDMEALRAQSVSEALDKLLKKYKEVIVYDDDLLEKYKQPWNIN